MPKPRLTPIKALPVNLITGFLGVGKTTAIRHLLAHKPADEHWAVLVNEMGEVGIDGPLLQQDGIAVRQVAGGCMCCVTGLPAKVTLNALIRAERPDRILIEPSGIANPRQILATYRSPEYQGVLDLRATICLIDPWMLTQPALLALETFQEQLALADILLASKADRASAGELQRFFELARKLPDKLLIDSIQQGAINPAWLDLRPTATSNQTDTAPHPFAHGQATLPNETPETPPLVADSTGVIRRENRSAEAWGCGWLFPPTWSFQEKALKELITQLDIPRIKGILLTDKGWLAVNRMRDNCHWQTAQPPESRHSALEMIALEAVEWLSIEQQLRQLSSAS